MAGTQGYKGRLYEAAGTPVSFTNEACTEVTPNVEFRITNADKRFWAPGATITVQKDGGTGTWVTASASTYTLERCGGVITFLSAIGASEAVRVSGEHLPVSHVADTREWSLDVERSVEDDSVLGDEWEDPVVLQGKSSGGMKLRWVDETWFDRVVDTDTLVLVLYVDYDNDLRYETFAQLTKDSVAVAVTALVAEELSWAGKGPIYYRTY